MAFGSKGYEPTELPRVPACILPPGCDFYKVRQSGRHAASEQNEPEFIQRFADATLAHRDYRNLVRYFYVAAAERGYILEEKQNLFAVFSKLRRMTSGSGPKNDPGIHLYCDVFVAAVQKCPVTDKDIYI